VAATETVRNRAAALRFAAWADCPYRAIGKENTYCPVTDDFTLSPNLGGVTVAQGSSVNVDLTATKTTGADQTVALSLGPDQPPGTFVTFPPTIQTDGTAHTITIDTTTSTTPGVYTLLINGTGASAGTIRGARVQVTVTGNAVCAGTNGSDVPIPDGSGSAVSMIGILGCGGNALKDARVDVKIQHPRLNQIFVTLISPTSTRYLLHERAGGEFHDIMRAYTVDLSGELANGTWQLEVQDVVLHNVGLIDSWTITLK
jgi:carboxypeptidase T